MMRYRRRVVVRTKVADCSKTEIKRRDSSCRREHLKMHMELKQHVGTSGFPRPRGMSSGVTIILKTCRDGVRGARAIEKVG